MFGHWRRVEEPSLRIVEKAQRHRGREQDLAVAGKTFTITVESPKATGAALHFGDTDEIGSLLPVAHNLCSAAGPEVRHDNVQLISVASHEVHGHQQAKKLMKQYKKGQDGNTGNSLAAAARALVSGNKRRFQEVCELQIFSCCPLSLQ